MFQSITYIAVVLEANIKILGIVHDMFVHFEGKNALTRYNALFVRSIACIKNFARLFCDFRFDLITSIHTTYTRMCAQPCIFLLHYEADMARQKEYLQK